MDSATQDLLAALLAGRDPEGATWSLAENHHLLVLLTTSLAILVDCDMALLVRRSASPPMAQAPPRPLAAKPRAKPEPDPDDGRQRVTVFFGTQTGTAEGFAKALAEEAKARYAKAVLKVVDLHLEMEGLQHSLSVRRNVWPCIGSDSWFRGKQKMPHTNGSAIGVENPDDTLNRIARGMFGGYVNASVSADGNYSSPLDDDLALF